MKPVYLDLIEKGPSIVDGYLVVAIHKSTLPHALQYLKDHELVERSLKIVDEDELLKDLANKLEEPDEGDGRIFELLDKCLLEAINDGSLGVE